MKKTIIIEGMSCMHCVMAVKNALTEVNGVSNISVDLQTKSAEVEVNNVSDDVLKNTIEEAGYEVIEIR